MPDANAYERIIERFVAWAAGEDAIRAAVVIGSRARKDHPADEWADLDIVIWSTNPTPYLSSPDWAAAIAEPLLSFVEVSGAESRVRERRVLFAGGLDVDFAFVDAASADQLAEGGADLANVFGRGARVLLDRDGTAAKLIASAAPAPTRAAPDAAALAEVAADFWYHAVWTAKHLRRGELWWAKGGCDGHLKELLRVVLEWDAAAQGRDPWFRGRFLEKWADPAIVEGMGRAFARYDAESVWAALAVTMDLFSRIARQLATSLALPYPDGAEEHARRLVEEYAATRGVG